MSLTSVCSWFVFSFVCTSSRFTHVWITSVFTILYIQFKNYWSLFKSRSFFTLLRLVSTHLKLSQMINFCFQNKLLEIDLFQKSGDQSCDWWCRGNRCCPISSWKVHSPAGYISSLWNVTKFHCAIYPPSKRSDMVSVSASIPFLSACSSRGFRNPRPIKPRDPMFKIVTVSACFSNLSVGLHQSKCIPVFTVRLLLHYDWRRNARLSLSSDQAFTANFKLPMRRSISGQSTPTNNTRASAITTGWAWQITTCKSSLQLQQL